MNFIDRVTMQALSHDDTVANKTSCFFTGGKYSVVSRDLGRGLPILREIDPNQN